ncbi:MAG: hypothetical protein WAV05_15100 [Anaerolineales bacterium]
MVSTGLLHHTHDSQGVTKRHTQVGWETPAGEVFRPIYFYHSLVEAAIINEFVLKGIVVWTWKYADVLLFHLACYRNPDLPKKPLNEVQDAADFVTIRVPKGKLGAPLVLEKNFNVRMHGFLQIPGYESLFSILDGSRQDTSTRLWIERLEA